MQPGYAKQNEFPRRHNHDGTIDSICPHCFVTVGTSTWESDLDRMEAVHVCEATRLKHFEEQSGRLRKDD